MYRFFEENVYIACMFTNDGSESFKYFPLFFQVRMNTIQGFQIYSPIGFMMYPCNFAHFCKECDNCDVSQAAGYFDSTNYDVVSFYSRDYVEGMVSTYIIRQSSKLISSSQLKLERNSKV